MTTIAILSSSVRAGRQSHKVALSLQRHIRASGDLSTVMLDLREYAFPLFDERSAFMKRIPENVADFTHKLISADAVILVTPVYNGSFPASLKNVIDLYYAEWKHKPVGIVSATHGPVPGIATVQALQTILLKLGAYVAPVLCTAVGITAGFGEDGTPADPAYGNRLFDPLLRELLPLIRLSGQ